MYETRVARVFSLFAGALAVLAVRAFTLQVVNQAAVMEKQRLRVHGAVVVAPRRGEILFADGTPIASNEPGFSVTVNLDAFFAPRWRCDVCGAVVSAKTRPAACPDASCGIRRPMTPVSAPDSGALARLLGVSKERFDADFDAAFERREKNPDLGSFDLVRSVDRDTAVAVALAAGQFPGVAVRCRPSRVVDSVAGDVVGRARIPDAVDAAALRNPDRAAAGERVYSFPEICSMQFGKSGLEAAFDGRLRGDPGKSRVDGRNEPKVELPVVDGVELTTTLRRDVQTVAEEIVHEAPGSSAAVVIDLADGAVVAAASQSKDGLNHAVAAIRPGSVFKLVTALALLESGVSPDETVHCTRTGRLPSGRSYVCDHCDGDIAFADAFAHSCNCYFETMAERVGIDAMLRACAELGLDVNPRLHLVGSPCGLERERRRGSHWRPADMAKIGIGLGRALVSPLQVATAYARVATGGRRLVPYIVDDDRPPAADVDPSIARFSQAIRDAARRCVTSGTAKDVRELDAVEAAGKSGTGDLVKEGNSNNAWFVAFAPASSPRFVAVVVYEAVRGVGATTAGRPVARLLAQALK